MALLESWLENEPDGAVITGSQLDDYERQTKRAVRERLEGDPAAPLTGIYEIGSFAAAPMPRAGSARLYVGTDAAIRATAAGSRQDGRMGFATDTKKLYHVGAAAVVEVAYLSSTGPNTQTQASSRDPSYLVRDSAATALAANALFAANGTQIVVQSHNSNARFAAVSFAGPSQFIGYRGNGDSGATTQVVNGSTLVSFQGRGYTSAAAWTTTGAGGLEILGTEAWTAGANGAKVILFVTANGGTATTTVLTLNQDATAVFGSTVSSTGFIGNITGNVTGNVTGSSGSTTGNAATATALQTGRTIWGQNFDGTAAISGALSGVTTLAGSGALSGFTTGAFLTSVTVNGSGTGAHLIVNSSGNAGALELKHTGSGASDWLVQSDGSLTAGGFALFSVTDSAYRLRISGTTGLVTLSGGLTISGAISGVTTLAGSGAVSGFTTASFFGAIQVTGGASTAGSMWKSAGHGLLLQGVAGSTNDFSIWDPAASVGPIINVPTGTRNVVIANGTLTVSGGTTTVQALTANGQITCVGASIRLDNAQSLRGVNATASTTYQLIGVTAGNLLSIDADARGTTFGAGIATPGRIQLTGTTADAVQTTPSIYRYDAAGTGGITLQFGNAAGTFRILPADASITAFSLTSAGAGAFASDLSVATTKKIYVDGGGDSYIIESSGNVVDHFVGGAQSLRLTATTATFIGSIKTADLVVVSRAATGWRISDYVAAVPGATTGNIAIEDGTHFYLIPVTKIV